MNPAVIVLIICCLSAAFAVWKEYRRANKAYLVLRLAAALLAAVALGCIILPVNYVKEITRQGDHSAVLLTAGFAPDSLNAYQGNKLFTTDRSVQNQYPKAKLIRLDELKADSPAISKLLVFGYGLDRPELSELGRLPVVFHPALAPGGIASVDWNQKLKTGEILKIQGKYKNDGLKPVKLVLQGLNTQLDTAHIGAKSYSDFELNTVPKNEGRALYHLLAIAGKDTLENESLPLEITPVNPLKILMLSASPDFETRFLKNWLSQNGFSVAVRSAISKDKFSSEQVNMPPLKIDKLSAALLDKFDLVIGDLSVLKQQSAVLRQEVTQKGLGIIIRADSAFKASSWLQNDFPVEKFNVRNPPPVSLTIKGRKDKLVALKIDPDYIVRQPGTQPLVHDAQNHLLVNSSLAGAGRLTFTTISNTYNWVLSGNKDDYGSFWSVLISNTARKAPLTENWSVGPQLPSVNEPASLQRSASSVPAQISADQAFVAPEQNPMIPFEWNGLYWPATSGWHAVKQGAGQLAWWYVYRKDEWQQARAMKKLLATRWYADSYAPDSSVTKAIHEKIRIEVPKIYFYLLLLLAVTFLWVEGKLSN
jgi:hypothetical protein